MSINEIYDAFKKIRPKHPDAIKLLRDGDFYYVFDEDAKFCKEVLNISYSKALRGGDNIVVAGFPHHALDTYLPKLIRAGKRVAICEQMERRKL